MLIFLKSQQKDGLPLFLSCDEMIQNLLIILEQVGKLEIEFDLKIKELKDKININKDKDSDDVCRQ